MFTIYAIETSQIYGHGNRLVIWFSGCTLKCKGCVNSHIWEKSTGKEYSLKELSDIVKKTPDIVGVTYIGGEPLQQHAELLVLTKTIISFGLDIVLFTGYELEELNDWQMQIVNLSAAVICGRYKEELRDTGLLLRGSNNQRLILNIPNDYYNRELRQVEVEITAEEDKFLGFPEDFL